MQNSHALRKAFFPLVVWIVIFRNSLCELPGSICTFKECPWHQININKYYLMKDPDTYSQALEICTQCEGVILRERYIDDIILGFIKKEMLKNWRNNIAFWINSTNDKYLTYNQELGTVWNIVSNMTEESSGDLQAHIVCESGDKASPPKPIKFGLSTEPEDFISSEKLSLCQGQESTLVCESMGSPPPCVKLDINMKNKMTIISSSSVSYALNTSSLLCGSKFNTTCWSQNIYDSWSLTREVSILCAPRLCSEENTFRTVEGAPYENLTLSICVVAFPSLLVVAYLNDTYVYRGRQGGRFTWDFDAGESDAAFTLYNVSIVLSNCTIQDNGLLTIVLSDAYCQSLSISITYLIIIKEIPPTMDSAGTASSTTSAPFSQDLALTSPKVIILLILATIVITFITIVMILVLAMYTLRGIARQVASPI